MWSVHPTSCENITIRNLTIRSTGGNGDGIDIDSCKHVTIDGLRYLDRRRLHLAQERAAASEAYTMLQTTEDVRISNCTFADSHLRVHRHRQRDLRRHPRRVDRALQVHRRARRYAIYIKSRPGRGAFIEDIFADGLEVSELHRRLPAAQHG